MDSEGSYSRSCLWCSSYYCCLVCLSLLIVVWKFLFRFYKLFILFYFLVIFWQLHSHTSHHAELDFEFLGNRKGKPYTLQTNVFTNGVGDREQRIKLWFDPTANFHEYSILWNSHHIVWVHFSSPYSFSIRYPLYDSVSSNSF